MNREQIIFRVFQVLFILSILPQTIAKVTQNPQFIESFSALGYPIYLTYILFVAYTLGFIGILQSKYRTVREWAYAGFTFALVGAFASHLLAEGFSKSWWALVPLTFLLISRYLYRKTIYSKTE